MYIVKAEPDQAQTIVGMSVGAFETDAGIGGVAGEYPPYFDSVEWHERMAREGHLYLAMIGDAPVGAAVVFPDETKSRVYIGRIFIDSLYHRQGYGIQLMKCIEKTFPFARSFCLDTPAWNVRTNSFYKKIGYRAVKTEDGFVYYEKKRAD